MKDRLFGSRKGGIPINASVKMFLVVFVAAIFLAVVLPLLYNAEGASGCVGPFKGVASVLADMTKINICS